jgi:hypothetical protein
MRRATLPEKLGLAAALLLAGCGGNHHVSPWGAETGPRLDSFLPREDLAAELALIDAETATLGLILTEEIRAELPPRGSGQPAVLRSYRGLDAAGRAVHAVRVATPRAVVLAVGPLEAADFDRQKATELVPTLLVGAGGEGGAFRSGTDLNGDGTLDVVLRNDAGALSIWHLGELGSGLYAVRMATPPLRGIDVEGSLGEPSGRIDLWGQLPLDPADPIAPRLADVATFSAGAYSDDTTAARAWHAREAARPVTAGSDAARLRAALERAWHAVLGGQAPEPVLQALRREPVPQSLRAAFELHVRTIATLGH